MKRRKQRGGVSVELFLARKKLEETLARFHRENRQAEAPAPPPSRPISQSDYEGEGRRLPDIEPNGMHLLTTSIRGAR